MLRPCHLNSIPWAPHNSWGSLPSLSRTTIQTTIMPIVRPLCRRFLALRNRHYTGPVISSIRITTRTVNIPRLLQNLSQLQYKPSLPSLRLPPRLQHLLPLLFPFLHQCRLLLHPLRPPLSLTFLFRQYLLLLLLQLQPRERFLKS